MIDEDLKDEKIIAIPVGDPSMSEYSDISQLPPHNIQEISHFFEVYKVLEGKTMTIEKMGGAEAAENVIKKTMMRYVQKYLIGDDSIFVTDSKARDIK